MTTESLILMIDNDLNELGAVLDMAKNCDKTNSPIGNLAPMLDRRYNNILQSRIRFVGGSEFAKFISFELENLFDSVNWDDMARHYLNKVREGVTVPRD